MFHITTKSENFVLKITKSECKKLAKAFAKALERKRGINWHLFMKIKENRRKGRCWVTNLHKEEIEEKIEENEENRGFNDKKAYED